MQSPTWTPIKLLAARAESNFAKPSLLPLAEPFPFPFPAPFPTPLMAEVLVNRRERRRMRHMVVDKER